MHPIIANPIASSFTYPFLIPFTPSMILVNIPIALTEVMTPSVVESVNSKSIGVNKVSIKPT